MNSTNILKKGKNKKNLFHFLCFFLHTSGRTNVPQRRYIMASAFYEMHVHKCAQKSLGIQIQSSNWTYKKSDKTVC